MIPIPKHSTKSPAYRLITLSSAFYKLTEFILTIRLDWYLERSSLIPKNFFVFQRGLGTLECLYSLTGSMYQVFAIDHFFQLRSLTFKMLMTHYKSQHLFFDFMTLKSLFLFARTYPPYFIYVIYHSSLL